MVPIKKGKVIARSAKKIEKAAPEPEPKSLTSEELDGVVGGAMVPFLFTALVPVV
jgi:hypothetical protein